MKSILIFVLFVIVLSSMNAANLKIKNMLTNPENLKQTPTCDSTQELYNGQCRKSSCEVTGTGDSATCSCGYGWNTAVQNSNGVLSCTKLSKRKVEATQSCPIPKIPESEGSSNCVCPSSWTSTTVDNVTTCSCASPKTVSNNGATCS